MFDRPLRRDNLSDFKPLTRDQLLVGSYYRGKYHVSTCEWALKIEHHRYFVDATDSEGYGYHSCQTCGARRAHSALISGIDRFVLDRVKARRTQPRVNVGDRVTITYEDGEIITFMLGGPARNSDDRVVRADTPMGWAVHKARLGDTVVCSPEGTDPLFALIIGLNGTTLVGPDRENARR
jgi:transcription elongation GreA/GreB family factor